MDTKTIEQKANKIFRDNKSQMLKITSAFLSAPIFIELLTVWYVVFDSRHYYFSDNNHTIVVAFYVILGMSVIVTLVSPIAAELITRLIYIEQDWLTRTQIPDFKKRLGFNSILSLLYTLLVGVISSGWVGLSFIIFLSIKTEETAMIPPPNWPLIILGLFFLVGTPILISFVSHRFVFINQIAAIKKIGMLAVFKESWILTNNRKFKCTRLIMNNKMKSAFLTSLIAFIAWIIALIVSHYEIPKYLALAPPLLAGLCTVLFIYIYTQKLTLMAVMYYSFTQKEESGIEIPDQDLKH